MATSKNRTGNKITKNGLTLHLDFNDENCITLGTSSQDPIDLADNYTTNLHGGANWEYKDGIGSYYFDDSDDYVEITNFVVDDASNTYEFWVYPAALSGWETIWDSGNERPLIGNYGSGPLRVYPDGDSGAVLQTGKWQHVVVAFASDDNYDVWLDGVKKGDAIDYSSAQRTGTFTAWLGGDNGAETFNGHIAIMRHYNRQLNGNEVRRNYNAERERFTSGRNNIFLGSGGTLNINGTSDATVSGGYGIVNNDGYFDTIHIRECCICRIIIIPNSVYWI